MEFVAIDVETANADMASICQIGIAEFKDGTLAEEWKTYVEQGCTRMQSLWILRTAKVTMKKLSLAGVAALSVLTASAAAHAETKEARVILPNTITGTWCWVEGGDEKNRNQQIFIRSAPEDCHVSDGLVSIEQDGIEGEGSCIFDKIEQTAPNAYLIYTYCDDDTNGPTMFEIVNGKLVITAH
jgi:hypothetical protein